MSDIDILNAFLYFWFKPMLVLSVILSMCKWSVARSPQSCHWLMTKLAIVAFICLPLSFSLPNFGLGIPSLFYFPLFVTEASGSAEVSWVLWVFYLFVALYVIVAFVLLDMHLFGFNKARALVNRAQVVECSQFYQVYETNSNVEVKQSSELSSPVAWGLRRPKIVLPLGWELWSKERLERILIHELAHIKRRDWLLKNMLNTVRAILWFLPAIWVVVKRCELYSEYACDDSVIANGASRAEYARDLLEFASRPIFRENFVSMSGSELATRINLVLESGRERTDIDAPKKFVALSSAIALILSFYSINFTVVDRHYHQDRQLEVQFYYPRSKPAAIIDGHVLNVLPKEEYLKTNQQMARVTNANVDMASPSFSLDTELFNTVPDISIERINADHSAPFVSMQKLKKEIVMPEYPKRALLRGWEASISVRFSINEHGQAVDIRFPNSVKRDRIFHRKIEEALTLSTFQAPIVDGQAIRFNDIDEQFLFKINNEDGGK